MLCEMNIREENLTNLLINFLKDSNKFVKVSAYKCIAPFIVTLSNGNINEKLLEFYV